MKSPMSAPKNDMIENEFAFGDSKRYWKKSLECLLMKME